MEILKLVGLALLLAALSLPIVLVLHESVHALLVLALGGKVTNFRPWPHRLNNRWVFGSVVFEVEIYSKTKLFLFFVTPAMVSFLMMLLMWVIAYMTSPIVYGVVLSFALDWLNFMRCGLFKVPGSDAKLLMDLYR